MPKRLTYKFVKNRFEKEGYKLLSKEYINSHTGLKFVCPNGHRHSMTWASFRKGHRCLLCRHIDRRIGIEKARMSFAKEGYKLLEIEYKNSVQKLEYTCPEGHLHRVSWSDWKHGSRCPHCSHTAVPSIEEVRSVFENEGHELLSNEYLNCHSKLRCKCPMGHIHEISYSNFKLGHRCKHCYEEIRSKNLRLPFEYVKNEFESEGFTLLSDNYVNAFTKLKYRCPKGHVYKTTWANWSKGRRCAYCSKLARLNFDDIKDAFEAENYTLLSTSYKRRVKLKYICPQGHTGELTWDNWKFNGRRCFKCSCAKQSSIWEKDVQKFVELELGIYFKPNDRNTIFNDKTNNYLELDIFFPHLKKAIECNGVYWHSKEERHVLDIVKKQVCKNMGIDLLILTDVEWKEDINKSKQKIIKFLEAENE